MEKHKMLEPKIEEYGIVVSIPLEAPILIVKNQTISEAEESFILKRDAESNYNKKVEFDRARALLKWAACCNAKLHEMHNEDKKLSISLSFSKMEDIILFRDSMVTNVLGA